MFGVGASGRDTDYNNRAILTTMAIPPVVRGHRPHTLVQRHRQHTNRRASKVEVYTGLRAVRINHLVSTRAAINLKATLVAPNTDKVVRICQGLPRTDKAATAPRTLLVSRTSPTRPYQVAITSHPSLASRLDSRIPLSLAHRV